MERMGQMEPTCHDKETYRQGTSTDPNPRRRHTGGYTGKHRREKPQRPYEDKPEILLRTKGDAIRLRRDRTRDTPRLSDVTTNNQHNNEKMFPTDGEMSDVPGRRSNRSKQHRRLPTRDDDTGISMIWTNNPSSEDGMKQTIRRVATSDKVFRCQMGPERRFIQSSH